MRWLCVLLFAKFLFLTWVITQGEIGLAPDEAQYWTWSQALDWGYYSKPPAIAWQIAFTTFLFGNTPFGVRFGALVLGLLISLAVYSLSRAAELNQNTSRWAACIAAFCPLGFYLSLAATTDAGMILFLIMAITLLVRGLKKENGPNYALIGFSILAGALFKWTAFVFWPFALIFCFFFKKLRSWKCLWGILISLLALLPSLYWNMQHEWATFRHVGRAIGVTTHNNFFDFLAAQMGLLFPIFFGLLACSYYFLKKEKKPALWLLAAFPFAILFFLISACFKKMQPNWAAYLYPAGIPLAAWVACERLKFGRVWLRVGTCLSIGCVVFIFLLPQLQERGALPFSYSMSPLRQVLGGMHLSQALLEAGYQPEKDFLFTDKYQVASLLSFYSPEQKRAYFFNVSESRKNQFSYWPSMRECEVGNTGYFVLIENAVESGLKWYEKYYPQRLEPYFGQVAYQGAFPLFSVAGEPVKYALIFACKDYSGSSPQDAEKY